MHSSSRSKSTGIGQEDEPPPEQIFEHDSSLSKSSFSSSQYTLLSSDTSEEVFAKLEDVISSAGPTEPVGVASHKRAIARICARRLKDKNADVRAAAVEGFSSLGMESDEHANTLAGVCLNDPDSTVRLVALEALLRMAKHLCVFFPDCSMDDDLCAKNICKIALPVVFSRMEDESVNVRCASLRTIATFPRQCNASTFKSLCSCLKDDEPLVKAAAIEALCKIGELGRNTAHVLNDVICALIPMLSDDAYEVRLAALKAMRSISQRGDHRVITAISLRLRDRKPILRQVAVEALGEVCEKGDPTAIAAVTARLHDANEGVRRAAVKALHVIAEKDDQHVIQALRACTDDKATFVRYEAADALEDFDESMQQTRLRGRSNVNSPHADPSLASPLEKVCSRHADDRRQDVRWAASAARWLSGEERVGAVGHESDIKRSAAVDAFGNCDPGVELSTHVVGANSKRTLLDLCARYTENDDVNVRWAAMRSLGWISRMEFQRAAAQANAQADGDDPDAFRVAVEALSRVVDSKHHMASFAEDAHSESDVGEDYVSAMHAQGDALVQTSLEEFDDWTTHQHNQSSPAKTDATIASRHPQNGTPRSIFTQQCLRRLEDNNVEVRVAALQGLASAVEEGDRGVVSAVAACIGDPNPDVIRSAVEVIRPAINSGNQDVLEDVLACLRCFDPHVRKAALEDLQTVPHKFNPNMISAVIFCLEDEKLIVREAAINTLREVGKTGNARVLKGVVARLFHRRKEVRSAAIKALRYFAEQEDFDVRGAVHSYFRHKDTRLRQLSVVAFSRIFNEGGAPITNMIIPRLRDPDPDVRRAAVKGLREVAPKTDVDAIQALRACSKDKNLEVRWEAAEAISHIAVKNIQVGISDRSDVGDKHSGIKAVCARHVEGPHEDIEWAALQAISKLEEKGENIDSGFGLFGNIADWYESATRDQIEQRAISVLQDQSIGNSDVNIKWAAMKTLGMIARKDYELAFMRVNTHYDAWTLEGIQGKQAAMEALSRVVERNRWLTTLVENNRDTLETHSA